MSDHEVFPHAPITEALVDIQVVLPEDKGLASLENFASAISRQFPQKSRRYMYHGAFEFKEDTAPKYTEKDVEHIGYVFRSQNHDKVVQGRTNGFSLSKLKPYERWESLRDEACKLWSIYCETMQPTAVTRLGMRYINRIEIPMPVKDFKDYVQTVPEIAEGVPQGLSEFFMRLVIPDPEKDLTAIVTSTMEPVLKIEDGEVLPYIFDIDVFRIVDITPESGKVWEIFERLRDFRNLIFFESTTERAKDLFR